MSYEGHGYVGKCRFKFKWNSTNCQSSKVTKRKMTDEELIRYGIKKEEDFNEDNNDH
ncbi:MAG: hypothetical protein J6D47_10505 [Peptostreptococcaceae bacterium]|nr:hypothetical protein [Peptostreptococcaceae bacterium]